MMDFDNTKVTCFGKVVFIRKNHTIPALPDMNLIVFKKEDIYQAVCIDIELDAIGDSLEDSCKNLKSTLQSYVKQMVDNYEGNKKAAVEDIVNTAYASGNNKTILFAHYLQAKRQYILSKIARENKVKSRTDDLFNGFKRFFQFEPIHFNINKIEALAA